jgi:protein-tyrosine phosphatase
VPDEIATDYALSAVAVAARTELADVPAPVLAARPETMVQFLTSLRKRHGSIEGLILHMGVGLDAVAWLRSLLLE